MPKTQRILTTLFAMGVVMMLTHMVYKQVLKQMSHNSAYSSETIMLKQSDRRLSVYEMMEN